MSGGDFSPASFVCPSRPELNRPAAECQSGRGSFVADISANLPKCQNRIHPTGSRFRSYVYEAFDALTANADGFGFDPPTPGMLMRYAVLPVVCLLSCLVLPINVSAQVAKTAAQPAARVGSFPNPPNVEALMSDYLEKLTERQETDLISRDDIQPLFKELEDIGWDVLDQKAIEGQLLEDSDWLVRSLRTTSGTKFMRKIAAYPGGYTQLDLLRQSSQGKKEVASLIKTPGGEELIELLATTKVGRNTSQRLAATRSGRSKPQAPRLYTKADVYKQLMASYATEAERRAKSAATVARPSSTTKSIIAPPAAVTPPPKPTEAVEPSSPFVD